jgi:spoIIIJ-associated protein
MTLFENEGEKEEFLKANKPKVEVKAQKERAYDPELSAKVQEAAKEYMEGFLKVTGYAYTLNVVEDDKDILVVVTGEEMGRLIGHHGEALDNIQFLLNNYIKGQFPAYERRVNLDIEHYRAKRENTIVDLALRLAQKVVKNKASMKLEPMNRYERKVIHKALQNKPHIDTHSEGVDPNRYLVIDYIAE